MNKTTDAKNIRGNLINYTVYKNNNTNNNNNTKHQILIMV